MTKEAEKLLGAAENMGENLLTQSPAGVQVKKYEKRKRKKDERKAAEEKSAARERLVPIPDPEAGKTQRRKDTARKRAGRGGRTSSILSDTQDTLG